MLITFIYIEGATEAKEYNYNNNSNKTGRYDDCVCVLLRRK